jgi:hypothetical protein
MAVVCDVELCSLVEVDRRFRGAAIASIIRAMTAVRT